MQESTRHVLAKGFCNSPLNPPPVDELRVDIMQLGPASELFPRQDILGGPSVDQLCTSWMGPTSAVLSSKENRAPLQR